MHESGHIIAHCAHAVHFSGHSGAAGWNPRALMWLASPIACRGHAEMHRPQPLHISSSMITLTRVFVLATFVYFAIGELHPSHIPSLPR